MKQQILMYKTAVCTLVNGVITHKKQQISKNVILLSSTLTLRQCMPCCVRHVCTVAASFPQSSLLSRLILSTNSFCPVLTMMWIFLPLSYAFLASVTYLHIGKDWNICLLIGYVTNFSTVRLLYSLTHCTIFSMQFVFCLFIMYFLYDNNNNNNNITNLTEMARSPGRDVLGRSR